MKTFKKVMSILIFMALYSVLSFFVFYSVSRNSIYPSGSDTMNYIYKANLLVGEFAKGNFYPLYDPYQYNGVQIMRLEPPLGMYILAFCQIIMRGNPFDGYILFTAFVCFISGASWLYVGARHKRVILGGILGALAFFMPVNLYNLFQNGNLPQAVLLAISPLFLHHVHEYLFNKKRIALYVIIAYSCISCLLDFSYTVMIASALLVFLIIYVIVEKELQRAIYLALAVIIGAGLSSVWLVPAFFGGGLRSENIRMTLNYFQDMKNTINPLNRLINNRDAGEYFGFGVTFISLIGIFFARKESKPSLILGFFILIATSDIFYVLLYKLPGSKYMNMLTLLPLASVSILFGFFMWKSLRNSLVIFFTLVLIIDAVPSMYLFRGNGMNIPVEMRMEIIEDKTLLDEAKAVTKQRMALLDGSTLGATPSYLISAYENPVMSTFGARYRSAVTAKNIVQLNEAINDGKYAYLFDRALELGNDTVLIQMDQVFGVNKDIVEIDSAAERVGYKFIDGYDKYRLYHIDTYEQFGVVSEYSGIAIGSSSSLLAKFFPNFEEADDYNLSHYTFDELMEYDTIYLAGFTYDDREEAELLVKKLASKGKRIVIAADVLPEVKNTGVKTFLGVDSYSVEFINGFPEFILKDGLYDVDMFPSGYSHWATVYLNNLEDTWGHVSENGEKLDFIGTVCDGNVVFVGFNLTYHLTLTKDETVLAMLEEATGFEADILPKRTLVPVEINAGKNSITITTDVDDVNTTLAYHDIFVSDQHIGKTNNLLTVNSGTTVVEMSYPYLKWGIIATVATLIFMILFMIQNAKWEKEKAAFEKMHEGDTQFKSYE